MRRWTILVAALAIVGGGAAAYLLKPVTGAERDTRLVGDIARGQYLMRLGGCVACHTDTEGGGEMLAGGAPLETQFGRFVAPNITPDPQHGIGGWTLATFANAMSNGMGPQGHLYPVFPYEHYTMMSDQEVADLYVALMASEPVAEPEAKNDVPFPFNIRLAMAAWKNLFFTPARFTPEEGRSDAYNRGRYLAYGPGHCVACHTPRNALGALEWGRALTGSPGGPGGRAPEITREALIEEGYDAASLAQTLRDGFTPGFDVLGGPMGEVIADSTSYWTDADLAAVAEFLMAE